MQRCGTKDLACRPAHHAHRGNHFLCSPLTTIASTCKFQAHTTTKLAEWFVVDPDSMSFSDLGHMCRRLPTQSTYGDAQECGAAVEFRRISSKLSAPVGSCRTGRLGSCE